jgi:hypothetical protein
MSWEDKSWKEAALEYHSQRGNRTTIVKIEPERLGRLLADNVSFEQVWRELNTFKGRAAASTVEALMLGLRSRGVCALVETDTRRRLAELSDEQLLEVGVRLRRLNPEIAAPWTADQVLILLRSRERCK